MSADAPNPVQAPMSAIAQLSGRSLDDLYRLFRLEGAPRVVAHVGGVPVYDVSDAMMWLNPPSEAAPDPGVSVDIAPRAV